MNIGFDATNILGHGGIKTYTRELITALSREYTADIFTLLTTFSSSKKKKLDSIFNDYPNVTIRRAVPHRNMLGDGLSCITRMLSSILWRLSTRSLDVVHLTDPYGTVVLPRKFVATIHDIFPLTLKEFSTSDLRRFYLRRTPLILSRAEAVITPSVYVEKSLRVRFPESACSIIPIPEAASDMYKPREGNREILSGYGLTDNKYFLFVGRIDPRKNIPGLIDAYLELPPEIRSDNLLALVLSGRPPDIEEFRNRYEHLLEGKGIVYLRDVPQEDLYSLYSCAVAFVFPTLDEGFGLPVLEAMKSGSPVITSDLSCIPEITADAAMLINPRDTDELAETMKLAAQSLDLREEYIRKGLARAAEFSWTRTARDTMAVYRSVTS